MGYKKGLVYAIGIGFMENYIPKASVIAIPSIHNQPRIIYKAIDEGGAWSSKNRESFKRINVSNQKKLNKAKLCHSFHYDSPLSDKFITMAQINNTIAMDSMVKFCKVAEGSSDIYFRPLTTNPKIWDFCPGDLLVREAGGKVTDFYGNSFKYEKDELVISSSGFFASNEVLYNNILELLEKII
jgi:3'-phosphoadenosine 5'-phosphosulfate (PAPS) 3'-phosphatase